MNTVKIIILFLIILGAQAFYMFLSSKNQMKSNWYLYVSAIPLVTIFPVIMYSHDQFAYSLYEYAVVICIMTAAVVDVVYAARHNEDYITSETFCGFLYAYLMIATAIAWYGSSPLVVRIISAILLAGSIAVCNFVKKHSLKEVPKALVLALFSVVCSWAFVKFGL